MSVDYCAKHERYFCLADGCPSCKASQGRKPTGICHICEEPIYNNEIVRDVVGKGIAHNICIKETKPKKRMIPLTAAEQYDQDRITRVT